MAMPNLHAQLILLLQSQPVTGGKDTGGLFMCDILPQCIPDA